LKKLYIIFNKKQWIFFVVETWDKGTNIAPFLWPGGMLIYLGNKIFKIAEPSIWAIPSRRLFGS